MQPNGDSREPMAAGSDREGRRQPIKGQAPFEELYCAAYAALDRHWLVASATYMEFPAVIK